MLLSPLEGSAFQLESPLVLPNSPASASPSLAVSSLFPTFFAFDTIIHHCSYRRMWRASASLPQLILRTEDCSKLSTTTLTDLISALLRFVLRLLFSTHHSFWILRDLDRSFAIAPVLEARLSQLSHFALLRSEALLYNCFAFITHPVIPLQKMLTDAQLQLASPRFFFFHYEQWLGTKWRISEYNGTNYTTCNYYGTGLFKPDFLQFTTFETEGAAHTLNTWCCLSSLIPLIEILMHNLRFKNAIHSRLSYLHATFYRCETAFFLTYFK